MQNMEGRIFFKNNKPYLLLLHHYCTVCTRPTTKDHEIDRPTSAVEF